MLKVDDSDPCHGYSKEFFIYDYDPKTNTCVSKASQLNFLATYYPDSFKSGTEIDILMWLYDMAEYRDE